MIEQKKPRETHRRTYLITLGIPGWRFRRPLPVELRTGSSGGYPEHVRYSMRLYGVPVLDPKVQRAPWEQAYECDLWHGAGSTPQDAEAQTTRFLQARLEALAGAATALIFNDWRDAFVREHLVLDTTAASAWNPNRSPE